MTRRLVHILTVGSVVLCAALTAAWARSYFIEDEVIFTRGTRRVGLYSNGGQLVVVVHRASQDRGRGIEWNRDTSTAGTPYSVNRLVALGLFKRVQTPSGSYCIFPHWPLAAFAAAPTGIRIARQRAARRRCETPATDVVQASSPA